MLATLWGIPTSYLSPKALQMRMMEQSLTGSTFFVPLLSHNPPLTVSSISPLPQCSAFILLRAEPALNHSICVSLKLWLSARVSSLPSLCFTTAERGWKRRCSHCRLFTSTAVQMTLVFSCNAVLPFLEWRFWVLWWRSCHRGGSCHSLMGCWRSEAAGPASSGWFLRTGEMLLTERMNVIFLQPSLQG